MLSEEYKPQSKIEEYLYSAIKEIPLDELPTPKSRVEVLLYELCTILSEGGGSGTQGPAGPPGPRGSGWLFGKNAPSNSDGEEGDLYIRYSNYDIFRKAGGTWKASGNIKGEKGDTGDQGPAGVQGETGPAGPAGAQGAVGPRGSGWLFGQNAPSNSDGKDGDLYIRYSNYDIYRKTDGTWKASGNIKGPAGEVQDATVSQKGIVNMAEKVDVIGVADATAAGTTYNQETIQTIVTLTNKNKERLNQLITAMKAAGLVRQ